MPLYEYACRSCGARFERIQKFSDPLPTACPTCGGPVDKLISSPAIQFKGSGFYITDYARSGQKSEGSGDATGSKDTATKGDQASESGAKDTGSKAEPSTAAAPKDAGSKDTGSSKDSGSAKDSGSKAAPASGSSSTASTPKP